VTNRSVVVGVVPSDLAGLAAEVVAVGVHVPQSPGGVGTELRPETLNIAAAVWVLGRAAHGDLRVANNGSTVQSCWAASSCIVAALVETCLARIGGRLLQTPTVRYQIASRGNSWGRLRKSTQLSSVGRNGSITVVVLHSRKSAVGKDVALRALANSVLSEAREVVTVLVGQTAEAVQSCVGSVEATVVAEATAVWQVP
jgi:hypothetical protein